VYKRQLQVIAEGVDREGTWNQLSALGCDLVQGYFISPPLPEKALSRWLHGWPVPASDLQSQTGTRGGLRLIG